MAEVWPATLPEYVLEEGYREGLQKQVITTQMDTGPSKRRRRFTKAVSKFNVVLAMSGAQVATFRTFWETTCKGGSLPFDMPHPTKRTTTTFLFVEPEPDITVRAGSAGEEYRVRFQMETY